MLGDCGDNGPPPAGVPAQDAAVPGEEGLLRPTGDQYTNRKKEVTNAH